MAGGYKVCSKCKADKPLKDFSPDNRKKGRTQAQCKKCRAVVQTKIYNSESGRDKYLSKYGITYKDYNTMFTTQNGCCAICGKHQSILTYRLAVDHNHKTGKVRGLLCKNCNTSLGVMEDSTELLSKAIQYLEQRNF